MAAIFAQFERTKQNHALPFFSFRNLRAVVHSADGRGELAADWTGLACSESSVHSLWYLGVENGERSFTKLNSNFKDEAIVEIQNRLGIACQ